MIAYAVMQQGALICSYNKLLLHRNCKRLQAWQRDKLAGRADFLYTAADTVVHAKWADLQCSHRIQQLLLLSNIAQGPSGTTCIIG